MNGQETWSSEWLDLAEMDLGAAEYLLGMRPVPVEIICYHCEQAAEKMLKGTLAQFGMEPPKTHDLIQLCKLCMERDLTYEEYVARLPVQGTNGVPALYIQGRELELGSGALMLEGRVYISAGRLAQALGWRVGTTFGGEEVVLYAGEHWYTLTPGETGRRDGQVVELSAPAVLLEGELYLALDDLNSLLELDLGLERTYVVDAAPAM